MPYAILIAILGGIVSTVFALFALRSPSAMVTAPFLGAILGLLLAVKSLRSQGLSLGASLEDYRNAAGIRSLNQVSVRFINIALGGAAIVSVVELSGLLFGQALVLAMLPAGCTLVVFYTLVRSWQVSDAEQFGKLDAIQVTGGIMGILLVGLMLYPWITKVPDGNMLMPDVVRVVFVVNAAAALEAAMLSALGISFVYRIMGLIETRL
ncbi:hypothetical protein J6500_26170 [Bradyrhizobium sp. WSM 1704]|uniref:hypothetical protein n=1 Tax=Bradyrhizobium semiaridum TaxID=2821404 RepID=UPI001CE2A8F7|nr:hypothetical protein [Bradyrhizobium semiaridum]MCA6125354.1 hypothetical protein [Bradyrhizobium semiaridum]